MTEPTTPMASPPEGNGPLDRIGPPLFRFGLAIALVVGILDQVSKWVILEAVMAPPRILPVFPGFNLTLVYNPGVSWGALDWLGPWALSGLAIAISAALVVWLHRVETRLLALAIGMIVGGAIGNVVDRVRFHAVVDFLDFYVPATDWPHWPAFNIADSAIVLGVGLILLDGLFAERQKNP